MHLYASDREWNEYVQRERGVVPVCVPDSLEVADDPNDPDVVCVRTRWRHVSDPPEDNARALVWAHGQCWIAYWADGEWTVEDWNEIFGIDLNDVTHWMPLPKGPR